MTDKTARQIREEKDEEFRKELRSALVVAADVRSMDAFLRSFRALCRIGVRLLDEVHEEMHS